MRTLLIDNYDSFTFNLYQLISEVTNVPPIVVRNDTADWSTLRDMDFDSIVISPGPGRPELERDFGVCRDAILYSTVPILGVCLGHQGICDLFGGTVDYAKEVMHGRPSEIHHDGEDLFSGIPSPFSAIRYHSLLVTELPKELEKTAWTDEGILMGVRHRERPIWGVQFHPESINTDYGRKLFENFRALTTAHLKSFPPSRRASDGARPVRPAEDFDVTPKVEISLTVTPPDLHGRPLRVSYRRICTQINAEAVFVNLYADSSPSFWLDSALVRGFSRFSYIGDASGPHAEFVSYDVSARQVVVEHNGHIETVAESIFTYLDRMLLKRRIKTEGLPFEFNGGYVGYFGYELKVECGGDAKHKSSVPDASFVFADRLIVLDHEDGICYLVCVDDEDHADRAEQWLDETHDRLLELPDVPQWSRALRPMPVKQEFRHSPDKYLGLIARCQEEIQKGESYEICLTNMITHTAEIDPLNTYRALRERNPAPYATYLNFPNVSVLSSSPERFMAIDASGSVEAKPIKGTRRRGRDSAEDEALYQDLRTSEKDRSENRMIVDLLRNDIGSVSDPGSVHVPFMFSVETYATVHQLVSTVRGRLRHGISAIRCIQASFPGGSMTGAPKKRTMEILDRLEAGPRGIYSGSIGFLGLNGSADLSIAIRTIVCGPDGVTIGVGGAIVALSDPQDELEEMILKSKALVAVLEETALNQAPPSKSASGGYRR